MAWGRAAAGAFGTVAVLAAGSGCGVLPERGPAAYRVAELGLVIEVPTGLRDLVHVMGEAGEGQRGAFFSTRSLASAGGPSCRAGARAAVSPYPLGVVVLSTEPPEQVAAERAENPEEGLGEYVTDVGDRHLYYDPPPAEPCAPDRRKAVNLQERQTKLLRRALDTARPG